MAMASRLSTPDFFLLWLRIYLLKHRLPSVAHNVAPQYEYKYCCQGHRINEHSHQHYEDHLPPDHCVCVQELHPMWVLRSNIIGALSRLKKSPEPFRWWLCKPRKACLGLQTFEEPILTFNWDQADCTAARVFAFARKQDSLHQRTQSSGRRGTFLLKSRHTIPEHSWAPM